MLTDNVDNPLYNLKNKMQELQKQSAEYSKDDEKVIPMSIEPYTNDPILSEMIRSTTINYPSKKCRTILLILWLSIIFFIIWINR